MVQEKFILIIHSVGHVLEEGIQLCGETVVVNLLEKNYKLAKRIKKLLSENPDLIFSKEKI